MERILNAIFWIIGLHDIRSSDPVLAAFKRARLSAVYCIIGEIICLMLAFAIEPVAGDVDAKTVAYISNSVSHYVANGFALLSLPFTFGLVWFAWKCWRIYTKPELYID